MRQGSALRRKWLYILCLICTFIAMMRDPTFARVISVFGRYGYRKASMSDLADAANISRQTLYNRFGSKQAVLDWVVEGISRESEALALSALGDMGGALEARIIGFFMEWLGVHTSAIHKSPHGVEIFEMGKASQKAMFDGSYDRCAEALSGAMITAGVATTREVGADLAFTLIMASKGLLIVSADEVAYEAGITRIVRVVLP
jgi:AcrR family transcriptional regulator